MKRTMNWHPDLPDHRDLKFKAKKTTDIKDMVDLREFATKIEDQGELGSCTAHAITSAIELQIKKNNGLSTDLSRLFVYYQERFMEKTVKTDSGAIIRDGIKACAKIGVPVETLWPYSVTRFTERPSVNAYKNAATRKILKYKRVTDLESMLHCLTEGNPVVFGFSVYESFESDKVAKTGIMPYPKKSEKLIGGHAVLAVGYDYKKERILVRNSWGEDWGLKGYFWMPFKVVDNRDMSDDFWMFN